MARKYSGKKGKSGSTKPVNKEVPSWLTYNAEEVEKLVVKIGKTEASASVIGLELRDSGCPRFLRAYSSKCERCDSHPRFG